VKHCRNWLLDHTGIGVSSIARSKLFYQAALKPLGIKVVALIAHDMSAVDDDLDDVGGVAFGIDFPVFWIDVFHPVGVRQHMAFRAATREEVDAFHREGLLAGGIDNGSPGLRSGKYPPGYYAAFLCDPDGNNIEAVCREQSPDPV
jgi:catechol 2,3-dioxygenase-like lactoylglutathione lyase family enzyme